MIQREDYLNKLIAFKDKQLIKVVTGIRRCGKSTLLELFKEYLLKNKISAKQIISINFDDSMYDNITDYKALLSYINKKIIPNRKNYIFLDEIQNVDRFQKALSSLYLKSNVDIYITGSNAYLLSGELATLLSGRYIEIKMLPLSFKEYMSYFKEQTDLTRKFRMYMQQGSFPYILEFNENQQYINDYLSAIYNAVVLKDIISRKKINDVNMLESIIKFMFYNVGNIFSSKKISDTMTSAGRKISSPTVENYLTAMIDSFVLYKVNRYDIIGKQYLKTAEKYYVPDLGLQRFILGSKKQDFGRNLENIVYLELLRRNYEIYIGKVNSNEVDFIAIKNGITQYYQVAETVTNEKTLKRELKPLENIKDNNQKFLITADEKPLISHNGIQQINIIDWLLDK
ncbi:ATP-binding protein [Candidatus Ruminimicrobium bovinum]|uniref:ATP-binding protein n=1 Tax=Candidatus Ruminimicrobium bovinum TaxID=3242779 RepID=UPI0039B99454